MEGIDINNEVNKYLHRQIKINEKNTAEEIELIIGNNERFININIHANIYDEYNIYMISPSRLKTYIISDKSRNIKNIIHGTKIKSYINEAFKTLDKIVIEIKMSSESLIEPGIWKIVFKSINVVSKIIDVYVSSPEILSKETKFIALDTNTNIKNKIIDYPNDCMGYEHLKLEDIDFRNLSTHNNQGSKLYKYKNELVFRENSNIEDLIKKDFDGYIPRYAVRHGPEFANEVNQLGDSYKFLDFGGDLGIIFTNPNANEDARQIYKLKGLIRLEEIAKLALLGEVREGTLGGTTALTEIGAEFIKNNPSFDVTGKGVLVGIIDTGIDYLHKDFIYPDDTSKVVYLWDQSKMGNPPNGYFFGSEYTREDINKAIKNNDPSLSQDEVGHGTIISGICAGLGNISKEYAGIAEDAELIVVKVAKINGNYNNLTITSAIQYIYNKAQKLNLPVVVNISFGSNFSVGLNSRLLFTDEIFPYLTSGFFIVAGAGNEGNTSTHAMGTLEYTGESVDVELEVSDDEKDLEIQILANKPDKIMISIISPSGEQSSELEVKSYSQITGIFDLERSQYKITYIYPTAYSGQQESRIRLTNARRGIWKIRIRGEYIIDGVYHLFLPNRVLLKNNTKFREPSPNYTINYPATLRETVAIGAYDTINKGIWATSSRGPTISGYNEPTILAPGVNIIGPYPGDKYGIVTGTSAAAAHVTGALVLYLQYTLVDKTYPDRTFIQQARTYLKAGADRSQNIVYPNNDYGYGLLNIRGMFEQLE